MVGDGADEQPAPPPHRHHPRPRPRHPRARLRLVGLLPAATARAHPSRSASLPCVRRGCDGLATAHQGCNIRRRLLPRRHARTTLQRRWRARACGGRVGRWRLSWSLGHLGGALLPRRSTCSPLGDRWLLLSRPSAPLLVPPPRAIRVVWGRMVCTTRQDRPRSGGFFKKETEEKKRKGTTRQDRPRSGCVLSLTHLFHIPHLPFFLYITQIYSRGAVSLSLSTHLPPHATLPIPPNT